MVSQEDYCKPTSDLPTSTHTFLLSVFNTVGTVILQNLRQILLFHSKSCKGSSIQSKALTVALWTNFLSYCPCFHSLHSSSLWANFLSYCPCFHSLHSSSTPVFLLGMSQPWGLWISCCLCCSAPPPDISMTNSSLPSMRSTLSNNCNASSPHHPNLAYFALLFLFS